MSNDREKIPIASDALKYTNVRATKIRYGHTPGCCTEKRYIPVMSAVKDRTDPAYNQNLDCSM
jgi:hypothetical protein